ncbi:MAG: replicative DNA helicase, partial [Nitrosomonas sp.]|nr:replicative DNA helicase [Nitrosomonas sp.]
MTQSMLSIGAGEMLEPLKTPPHSIETEQSVLGGLMLDNQAWDKIADVITDDDFYRHDHRLIYRHICKLIEHNKPADVVTVAESLELSAELQTVGGLAYIGSIVQNTPSAANIKRYAEIVRERSIMRNLAQIGVQITESAYSPAGRSAAELLDEAEYRVFEIAEEGARGKQGFVDIQPLLKEVVERIELLYSRDNPSEVTGIASGFHDLDQKTSGFQPGDLIIVAGRPSMGKTAFSLNIAEHVALELKKP